MADNDSLLECLEQSALEPNSSFDIIWQALMRGMARIPRVARLIRSYQNNLSDTSSYYKALTLIQILSQDSYEEHMTQLLQRHATVIPTTLDHAWVMPESWSFDSIPVYELVVRFYSYQMLLCGLAERLCEIVPFTADLLSIDFMRMRDQEAALSVAMCVQHGMTMKPTIPLASLRLHPPLQIACGTWHRLAKRQIMQGFDPTYTQTLKAWYLQCSNEIGATWKIRSLEDWEIDLATDAVAGGGFPEFMKKRTDPETILATHGKR